jgi:hypothetical protein
VKKRPVRLLVLACFLMAIAGAFPAQVMWLNGHHPWELVPIAAGLASLNWCIIGIAPLTAYLALRASPWLLGALPALIALVVYNNSVVASFDLDFTPRTAWIASLGFVAVIGAMFNRAALHAVLNPHSRWWLTPLRKRLHVSVRLKLLTRNLPKTGLDAYNEFQINTYDLSEGGAFIPLDQTEAGLRATDARKLQAFGAIFKCLPIGTQCYVCLPLKDVSFIQCRAEVVRTTQGRGEYPAGVGLRFLGLSWAERRRLSGYLGQVG